MISVDEGCRVLALPLDLMNLRHGMALRTLHARTSPIPLHDVADFLVSQVYRDLASEVLLLNGLGMRVARSHCLAGSHLVALDHIQVRATLVAPVRDIRTREHTLCIP